LFEPLPKNQVEFKERMLGAKSKISLIAQDIAKQVLQCLEITNELNKKITSIKAISKTAHEDIEYQFKGLIHSQFVSQTKYEQLTHIPRYLKGILVRIEKMRSSLARDQENQLQLNKIYRQYIQILKNFDSNQQQNTQREDIRWQFEELRVAIFAQELKTPTPMSLKRMEKILNNYQG